MKTQAEIRSEITNSIIESLSEGRIPWRKPWRSVRGPNTAMNFVTKRPYAGVNRLLTMFAEVKNNYPTSFWGTFNQFRAAGCKIKKGSKATQIVFFQQLKKTVTDRNGEEQEKTIPLLKTWNVFNVAQADGLAIQKLFDQPPLNAFDDDSTEFDAVVAATEARITYGNEIAAYIPSEDRIVMPDKGRFDSFPDFAATLFHELTHWSQPSHRLAIEGEYAENELFAEISSSFLMAELGIPHADNLRNTKAYIQGWITRLKNDPKAIFKASSLASKAADYILSFSRPIAESVNVDELEEAAV